MNVETTSEIASNGGAHGAPAVGLQRLVSLRPYYQDQSVTIYHGDSFEIMPQLQTDSVDVVMTDPPYGAKTHDGARTSSAKDLSDVGRLVDFECITDEQFEAMARECLRLTKRWIVMTCEWRHAASIENKGLPLVRLGVWIKPNPCPQFTGDRPATGWEAVMIMHRNGKKRWNGGGKPATWIYNKINGQHPTEKPIQLLHE